MKMSRNKIESFRAKARDCFMSISPFLLYIFILSCVFILGYISGGIVSGLITGGVFLAISFLYCILDWILTPGSLLKHTLFQKFLDKFFIKEEE